MEKMNQNEQEYQRENKRLVKSNFLALYIDIVIRGLIGFFFFGALSYYVLFGYFTPRQYI